MFKKLIFEVIVASVICGANAMDQELEKWKEWTPMVGGMPFPKMAIDSTEEHPEPEILSSFHKTRERLGYRCFMPKTQEEMDLLYNAYKAGVFVSDLDTCKCAEEIECWGSVLMYIEAEIKTRCRTGDMYHINKFLDHLDVFVSLAVHHLDREFIGNLFGEESEFDGLHFCLSMAAPDFEKMAADTPEKRKNVIYVLARLDEIRTHFGAPANLLSTVLYLEGFFETEEGKKMQESFDDYMRNYGFHFSIK